MPNWCSNQIEISGDDDEIKIVQDIICDEEENYSLTNNLRIYRALYARNHCSVPELPDLEFEYQLKSKNITC